MPNNYEPQPFKPAWWLRGRHAQSIGGRFLRDTSNITFEVLRLDTPDGDFLDLDFAIVKGYEHFWAAENRAPIVLALHGLEGSARSTYMYELYRRLAKSGVRAIGLNFRSCSGVPNQTGRLYHSGETGDFKFVLETLYNRFPDVKFGVAGFSLGANALLKGLAEMGKTNFLTAAAAVSPPFDLGASCDLLTAGFNRVYNNMFVQLLKKKTRQLHHLVSDKIDLDAVMQVKTLREYDGAVVAPIFGFRDAQDYYDQSSSGRYVEQIQIPTLILRSMDDPFFDPDDIPHEKLAANPHISATITERGGHVGFISNDLEFWGEQEAANFLAQKLA
jgi:predicted alpha/beta-fold hydrolase